MKVWMVFWVLLAPVTANAAFLEGYTVTGAPAVGYFYAANPDASGLRDRSLGYGGYATVQGSLVKSASFRKETSDWSVLVAFPVTVDYGLEVGYFKFPHALIDGQAQLYTARPALTFFKMFSVGVGVYAVQYAGTMPAGLKTPGFGFVGAVQATPLFPSAPVRPFIEARTLTGSLRGTLYSVGVVIGGTP